jgi:hypothetical protein
MTFRAISAPRAGDTVALMNNMHVTPTTVSRAVFLGGRASCSTCGVHVRPGTSSSAFVRIYRTPLGSAWCSVCGTTTNFDLAVERAA